MDKGASVYDLAGGFVNSKEFADLYTNILHRAPDQAG
jgi:hypothetical protein